MTFAVELCAKRVRDGRGQQQQMDARLLIISLRQVVYVADLGQRAMSNPAAKKMIGQARKRFDEALPDLVAARDALVHLDEFALGVGKRQRRSRADPVSIARDDWSFGYDPVTRKIRVGRSEFDLTKHAATLSY